MFQSLETDRFPVTFYENFKILLEPYVTLCCMLSLYERIWGYWRNQRVMKKESYYSVGEIADKTGVSVRTLHYYDELGLLTPKKDPSTGHRKYRDQDIIQLQKIISYKFLGFSLDEIKNMLSQEKLNGTVIDSLTLQKKLFEEEIKKINTSIKAIERTMKLIKEHGDVDSTIIMSLIRSMQTEESQWAWFEGYFGEDVASMIYNQTENKIEEMDDVFVQFTEKVKELIGTSVDSPEVMELMEEYTKATMSLFDENLMEMMATKSSKLEEINLEELEKMAPSPFSKQEEEWLHKAMMAYIEKVGFEKPE